MLPSRTHRGPSKQRHGNSSILCKTLDLGVMRCFMRDFHVPLYAKGEFPHAKRMNSIL